MPDELYSCVVIPENILFVFNALYNSKRNNYVLVEYDGKLISLAKFNTDEQKLKYLDTHWQKEEFEEISSRFVRHIKQSEKFTQ